MTRASVQAEIDQLDALNRERTLNPRESERLAKLVTVMRRYDYSAGKRPA